MLHCSEACSYIYKEARKMVQCPKCKQPLKRTRRKPIERTISYILPVSRYACHNHACRWTGLLVNWSAHPIFGTSQQENTVP